MPLTVNRCISGKRPLMSIHTMEEDTHDKYVQLLESALNVYQEVPGFESKGPACLKKYLHLGDFGDSNSHGLLSELGVTHLLNCAGVYTGNRMMTSYKGTSGMRGYKQLEAHDNEKYDMLAHFTEARDFIDDARKHGGKVLVYCARGVNRSAAICVAYLIEREHMDLCEAVNAVAFARGHVLTNPGFRKQLVTFAAERNMLEPVIQ